MWILPVFILGCLTITPQAHKRQFIGNVKIDNWSGPFFNNNQQRDAFENLVYGDVTGNKRTDFPDINPEEILNPVPIKPERKTIKDEGPVAETYIGKNPEEDAPILVNPQERLANFVSKPIIHSTPVNVESVHKRYHHYRGDKDRVLESRRYMFNHHHYHPEDSERRHFDDDRYNDESNRRFMDDHRRFMEARGHEMDYPAYRRDEMSSNNDNEDSQPRFPDHERDRFEERDEDREKPTTKRSLKTKRKTHKKKHKILKKKGKKFIKEQSGKKKSDLGISGVSGHIPEALMPGGIPDPSQGMEADAANVPSLEMKSAGEAEGQLMENQALQDTEGQPVGTAVNSHYPSSDHGQMLGNANSLDGSAADGQEDSSAQTREEGPVGTAVDSPEHMDINPEYKFQDTPGVPSDLSMKGASPATSPGGLQHDSGSSDTLLEGGSALSLAGVGLNSHSGVKEMSDWKMNYAPIDDPAMAQENSFAQANNNLPVNRPPGAGVEEKVVNGEATLQSEEHDDDYPQITPEGQKQETVDQNTIYVHHHPEKSHGISDVLKVGGETNGMKKHHVRKTKTSHLKKLTKDVTATKKSIVEPPKMLKSDGRSLTSMVEPSKVKKEITPTITKKVNEDNNKIKKRWGHSTEHQNGFLEDNASTDYYGHGGMGGGTMGGGGAYGSPFLMTIGQHEGSDIHKEWNNMHSPGNGFYSGSGVGPARTFEGEYIHHNQHDAQPWHGGFGGGSHGYGGGYGGGMSFGGGGFGMGHGDGIGGFEGHGIFGGEHGDPLHSLEESHENSDHETAGLIEGIWGHDYDGDHEGHGHHGHGHEGVNSFFGHGDQGTLLPSETLDGIAGGGHGGYHGSQHWGGGHHGLHHNKAIQALQDDTTIDSQLQTMGIGMEIHGLAGHHNGGRHHAGHKGRHGHQGADSSFFDSHDVGNYAHHLGGHHGGGGMEMGGMGHGVGGFGHGGLGGEDHVIPPVDVPHDGHQEMSPEEYHNHIDSLMNRYHQLEVDMKGTHGSIMDHIDENLLHHHGHPHYHTGYDLYAYQNPWHNAQLPYHIPVENHPDGTDVAPPETGGGSMEQGGKDDGKGEEKGGPLIEPKDDGKPPPKKDDDDDGGKKDDKDKDKPVEIHKKPDWDGMPPKIPKQRGGPEQSGSVGLNKDNELTGNLPKDDGKLGPLRQAISAYKAMNLSVPPTLQIQELQEELKLAKAQQNAGAEVAQKISAPSVAKDTKLETKPTHSKTGDAKDKAPEKAALPNGAAEVTQAISTMGGKAASTNPQAAVAYQRLQQLNFLQQGLLKEMLVNAVKATKEGSQKVDKMPDDEQHTVEKILNIGHENDRNVQQAQLLAQLNNMMRQSATNTAFNHLVNSVSGTQNFVKNPSPSGVTPTSTNSEDIKPSAVLTADVKSTSADKSENKEDLNAIVGKILNEAKESETNKDSADLDASALTPSDAPTLDLSDSEKAEASENKENSDLISLLNSPDVHKKKHHKKKHHTSSDDAYAKIGYESPGGGAGAEESGTKKNKANYVALKTVSPETSEEDDETTKKANIKDGKKN